MILSSTYLLLLPSVLYQTCKKIQKYSTIRVVSNMLPIGQVKGLSLGRVVFLGSLPVFAGGIWYYLKTNPEEPVAQKPTVEEDPEEKAMKKRFEEWMVVHKRRYKDEEEKARCYELFKGCVRRVNELNAASRPGGVRYKPYQYTDFTKEEKSKTHGMLVEPSMFWNDEQRRKIQGGHHSGADWTDKQIRAVQWGHHSAALDGKVYRSPYPTRTISIKPPH